MRKIIGIISFMLLSVCLIAPLGVDAQQTTMVQSGDTVINTATKACSIRVVNSYREISIQAVVTKISGTVAGTITLQGTIDGITWITVDTAALRTDGPSTFVTTNVATNSKVWIIYNAPYTWFKLSYTGSGTMSASLKGYILPRQ